MWIGGILVAATIAFPSLTPAKIVTAVGLGVIAIGLAFKDIFENFVAGILILFREPFKLNDFIECDDFEGVVEDVDAARDVIRKAVEQVDSVMLDKPVQIFAQAFGASSIDFEVTWWTGSKPREIRESRDQVVASVKRALDDAGIEIPFPYRTLIFSEPLTLTNRDGDSRDNEGQEASAT